ncbi:MAG TPA: alpha-amylase family protein [Spirochaetia bacterium]|nr:alpha-amylase family protein [Spirochaetia bacterium]
MAHTSAANGRTATENLNWYEKPLRILQTVLREVDAEHYDAAAVAEHMVREQYNVLVVNGGGIFDFFQSDLEFANPVEQMRKRDILKEISEACAKAGIKVIARVDFRGVHEKQYRRHPDWFGRDEAGDPLVRPTQSVHLFGPCYNSYYRNEYAAQFIRYLFEHYAIDGIWHNAVLSGDRCFCDRCQELYRSVTGHPIPSLTDPSGSEEYDLWKSERAKLNLQMLRKTVKNYGDDKVYVAEVFSMFDVKRPRETGLDLYDIRDLFDFLVSVGFLTENRANAHYTNLTYATSIVKLLREIHPAKQPVVLFGGNGTSYRFVADPPRDLAAWAYQTVAAGGGYWNCLFNGTHPGATHDRRNAHFLAETNGFLKENTDLLTEIAPENEVAVLYSKQTKDRVGADDPDEDRYNLAVQGVERVLVERHRQYSFVTEETLSPGRLSGVKVLILPNVACLSDDACGVITRWVESGGRLIATFMTSLLRPDGTKRADFGLASLFGCSFTGEVTDTSYDCYQEIALPAHPVIEGIGDTEVIRTGPVTAGCTFRGAAGSKVICYQVPIIKNQPPEHAWRVPMRSEAPAVVETAVGKGSVLYFASQIDRAVMLDGHSDFTALLANAVCYFIGKDEAVATNAPESLIVTRLSSVSLPGSWMVSFINTTSAPLRPLRSIIPLRDIAATVRVPDNARAAGGTSPFRVTSFGKGGEAVRVRYDGGHVAITIPEVHEFLSLRFDPAP